MSKLISTLDANLTRYSVDENINRPLALWFGLQTKAQAVINGISQFKAIHINILMCDALWAAAIRAENAAKLVGSHRSAATADIAQIEGLIQQARSVADDAISEGSLNSDNWIKIDGELDLVITQLSATPKALTFVFQRLSLLADQLDAL